MPSTNIIRYQPCLLDKLVDNSLAGGDASRTAGLSTQAYEAGLMRDLEWLLNSHAHVPVVAGCKNPLFEYPHARDSGINYGIRQMVGSASYSAKDFEERITLAIRIFEPRINPQTLMVKARLEGNAVFCEIEAEYWAEPVPIHKLIKTKMDLETGSAEMLSGPGGRLTR